MLFLIKQVQINKLKNRGIDEEIIQECVNKKLIYQEDKTNNIVFLGYDNDGNVKYAGCRSTNNKRIMRDARGSSKEFSFRMLSNIKNNTIHIFESSIDLLSYATINLRNGIEIRDVADILGHKYIETTENFYISSTDENKKEVSNVFDNLMSSKTIDKIIKYEIAY